MTGWPTGRHQVPRTAKTPTKGSPIRIALLPLVLLTCTHASILLASSGASNGQPEIVISHRHGYVVTDPFRLSNGRLKVAIDSEHGDLVGLTEAYPRQNFAGTSPSGAGLWEMALSPAEKILSPADAKSFHSQSLPGEKPGLRLTWEHLAFRCRAGTARGGGGAAGTGAADEPMGTGRDRPG